MGNVHKFKEHYQYGFGVFQTSLGGVNSDIVTFATWVDMNDYDLVVGQGIASLVASAKVITLAAWQATTSAGAGSKTVSGASDTFTSTNTTDKGSLICQVRGEDLDVASSFRYVSFKMSTNQTDGTESVAGFILAGRARYKQATMPAL